VAQRRAIGALVDGLVGGAHLNVAALRTSLPRDNTDATRFHALTPRLDSLDWLAVTRPVTQYVVDLYI
jgi:hypothetical protein